MRRSYFSNPQFVPSTNTVKTPYQLKKVRKVSTVKLDSFDAPAVKTEDGPVTNSKFQKLRDSIEIIKSPKSGRTPRFGIRSKHSIASSGFTSKDAIEPLMSRITSKF